MIKGQVRETTTRRRPPPPPLAPRRDEHANDHDDPDAILRSPEGSLSTGQGRPCQCFPLGEWAKASSLFTSFRYIVDSVLVLCSRANRSLRMRPGPRRAGRRSEEVTASAMVASRTVRPM